MIFFIMTFPRQTHRPLEPLNMFSEWSVHMSCSMKSPERNTAGNTLLAGVSCDCARIWLLSFSVSVYLSRQKHKRNQHFWRATICQERSHTYRYKIQCQLFPFINQSINYQKRPMFVLLKGAVTEGWVWLAHPISLLCVHPKLTSLRLSFPFYGTIPSFWMAAISYTLKIPVRNISPDGVCCLFCIWRRKLHSSGVGCTVIWARRTRSRSQPPFVSASNKKQATAAALVPICFSPISSNYRASPSLPFGE
jgi:hypothetical protein